MPLNNNMATNMDEISNAVTYLKERFKKLAAHYNSEYFEEVSQHDQHLILRASEYTQWCYSELEKNLKDKELPDPSSYFSQSGYVIQAGKSQTRVAVAKVESDYLYNARKLVLDYQETSLPLQKDMFKEGDEWLFNEVAKIIEETPIHIKVFYEKQDLLPKTGDSFSLKVFKFRKRTWAGITRKPISINILFRELVTYHVPAKLQSGLYKMLKTYGKSGFLRVSGLQALFSFMKKSFTTIEDHLIRGSFSHKLLHDEMDKALQLISKLSTISEMGNAIEETLANAIQLIKDDLQRVDINRLMNRRRQMQITSGKKLKKKITEIPNSLYKNQSLFISATLMDLLLKSAQNQLSIALQKVITKIHDTFKHCVLETLEKEHKTLMEFADRIKEDPFADFNAEEPAWGNARDKNFYKEIMDQLAVDVKEACSLFPEAIEMMGDAKPGKGKKAMEIYDAKQFEKIDTISISLNRLAKYIIQANLTEPVRQLLLELPVMFEKSITVTGDVTRLIAFSINNPERDFSENGDLPNVAGNWQTLASGETSSQSRDPSLFKEKRRDELQKSIIDFLNEGDGRIKNELSRIKEQQKRTLASIGEALKKTCDTLEPRIIIASAGNLTNYVKKSKKRISLFEKVKAAIPVFRNMVAKLWYRKSESLLAARKLSLSAGKLSISAALWHDDENEAELRVDELLDIVEFVSPDQKVLDKLPFYYRQLFLGKQNVDRAFWTGRKQALADADKAVERFRRGMERNDASGGLLVIGEQSSGKTYLSQYIAVKFFNKKKIFYINPPEAGSANISVFNKTVKNAVNAGDEEKPLDKILSLFENECVFILNDIELWWERKENGLEVIEQILNLINRFGARFFFIVNANTHSFRYLNKMLPFSNSFLKILECEPFNAEDLKDIILFRHKSTGIKYRLKNYREEDINGWRQAKLFSKYFNYSKGNVGVALNAWVSNITTVALGEKTAGLSVSMGTGTIHIREPKLPLIARLKHINPDWLLLIIQFVLHKRLTLEKLCRITLAKPDEISPLLNDLIRARVAVYTHSGKRRLAQQEQEKPTTEPDVFELNRFLRPHLVNNLVERGVL